MEYTDCTFKTKHGNFTFRVAAIIINCGKILMVANSKCPYYYSVGGRARFGEKSESAVLREAFEETGLRFEIDRLGFVYENFFAEEIFNEDNRNHEIAFHYYMKPMESYELNCTSIGANDAKERLEWLDIDRLKDYSLYPEFYKSELLKPLPYTKHIVEDNEHLGA
ncbi:NUDIX hydrolase [Clostridia bacterium]|nr:NUDIX hydrolase [Clostridia bacterium]